MQHSFNPFESSLQNPLNKEKPNTGEATNWLNRIKSFFF